MSISLSRLPRKVRAHDPITAEEHNKLVDFLKDLCDEIKSVTLCSSTDITANKSPGGTYATIKKNSSRSSSIPTETICLLGQITTWTPEGQTEPVTGIRGGVVTCADKNLTLDNKPVDLTTDSDSLVYLSIDFTTNTDDDGEILLPGIESCETTAADAWGLPVAWAPGAQYPPNRLPTVTAPTATIIIPIGKLTIKDSKATLENSGCGNVTIAHCGGVITYSRA